MVLPLGTDVSTQAVGRLEWVWKGGWCIWQTTQVRPLGRLGLRAVLQDVAWCCTTGCGLMLYYRMRLDAVLQDAAWCCTTGCGLMLYYRMWLDAVLQDAAWCCTTGCGLMLYYRMWLECVLQVKKSGGREAEAALLRWTAVYAESVTSSPAARSTTCVLYIISMAADSFVQVLMQSSRLCEN